MRLQNLETQNEFSFPHLCMLQGIKDHNTKTRLLYSEHDFPKTSVGYQLQFMNARTFTGISFASPWHGKTSLASGIPPPSYIFIT